MKIDNNIAQKYNLTKKEIALSMSAYVPLTIKADDFFLQEGKVSNYIGFVTKGLLRSFIYDDYANEITSDLL